MYRERARDRSFWVFWDSAQKVAFGIPWLVDEVNRRSGDRIRIDVESLAGKDDRAVAVAARTFDGRITSVSGQVNWLGLKSTSSDRTGEYQLALINHAEATVVTVDSGFEKGPTSVRMFDEKGRPAKGPEFLAADGKVKFRIPEEHMALVAW